MSSVSVKSTSGEPIVASRVGIGRLECAILFATLMGAACDGRLPVAPSQSPNSSTGIRAPDSPPNAAPNPPPAVSERAEWSLAGPRGCLPPASHEWVLTMSDAGAAPLRFLTAVSHHGAAKCEPTLDNLRTNSVYLAVSGATTYAAHERGETRFRFDSRSYDCGRVQVDVSLQDASGREVLVFGEVVNYRVDCAAPPPPAAPNPPPPPPPTAPNPPSPPAPKPKDPRCFDAHCGPDPCKSVMTWNSPPCEPKDDKGDKKDDDKYDDRDDKKDRNDSEKYDDDDRDDRKDKKRR